MPLHSRCTVIDFAIKNGQKVKTAQALLDRLSKVLTDEDVNFDKKVLAELIQKYYPDFRRTINELQRYSVRGKIDSGILFSLSEANTKELVKILKEKKDLMTCVNGLLTILTNHHHCLLPFMN